MNGIVMRTQNGPVKLPEDRLAYVVDNDGTVWVGYPRESDGSVTALDVTGFWVTQWNELRWPEVHTWPPEQLRHADILRAVNPTPGEFHFDKDGMRYYGIRPKPREEG